MASIKRSAVNEDSNNNEPISPIARSVEKKKRKVFRFESEMISNLLTWLLDYKTMCEFENIDFNGDKVKQYSEIRIKMATIYEKVDVDYFGPPKLLDNSQKKASK